MLEKIKSFFPTKEKIRKWWTHWGIRDVDQLVLSRGMEDYPGAVVKFMYWSVGKLCDFCDSHFGRSFLVSLVVPVVLGLGIMFGISSVPVIALYFTGYIGASTIVPAIVLGASLLYFMPFTIAWVFSGTMQGLEKLFNRIINFSAYYTAKVASVFSQTARCVYAECRFEESIKAIHVTTGWEDTKKILKKIKNDQLREQLYLDAYARLWMRSLFPNTTNQKKGKLGKIENVDDDVGMVTIDEQQKAGEKQKAFIKMMRSRYIVKTHQVAGWKYSTQYFREAVDGLTPLMHALENGSLQKVNEILNMVKEHLDPVEALDILVDRCADGNSVWMKLESTLISLDSMGLEQTPERQVGEAIKKTIEGIKESGCKALFSGEINFQNPEQKAAHTARLAKIMTGSPWDFMKKLVQNMQKSLGEEDFNLLVEEASRLDNDQQKQNEKEEMEQKEHYEKQLQLRMATAFESSTRGKSNALKKQLGFGEDGAKEKECIKGALNTIWEYMEGLLKQSMQGDINYTGPKTRIILEAMEVYKQYMQNYIKSHYNDHYNGFLADTAASIWLTITWGNDKKCEKQKEALVTVLGNVNRRYTSSDVFSNTYIPDDITNFILGVISGSANEVMHMDLGSQHICKFDCLKDENAMIDKIKLHVLRKLQDWKPEELFAFFLQLRGEVGVVKLHTGFVGEDPIYDCKDYILRACRDLWEAMPNARTMLIKVLRSAELEGNDLFNIAIDPLKLLLPLDIENEYIDFMGTLVSYDDYQTAIKNPESYKQAFYEYLDAKASKVLKPDMLLDYFIEYEKLGEKMKSKNAEIWDSMKHLTFPAGGLQKEANENLYKIVNDFCVAFNTEYDGKILNPKHLFQNILNLWMRNPNLGLSRVVRYLLNAENFKLSSIYRLINLDNSQDAIYHAVTFINKEKLKKQYPLDYEAHYIAFCQELLSKNPKDEALCASVLENPTQHVIAFGDYLSKNIRLKPEQLLTRSLHLGPRSWYADPRMLEWVLTEIKNSQKLQELSSQHAFPEGQLQQNKSGSMHFSASLGSDTGPVVPAEASSLSKSKWGPPK